MAQWLEHMLAAPRDLTAVCPLCEVEARFAVNDDERLNEFLCGLHGGGRPEVLALIRRHLARIAAGERFDQRRPPLRERSRVLARRAFAPRDRCLDVQARGGEHPTTADDLTQFKIAVAEVLTKYASGILLDPEYGLPAIRHKSPNVGVLLAYEQTGTYQLLLPYMSDPTELGRFYTETVRPLVAYDEQYETDLVQTLETFLDADGNVAGTAQRLFTHRHTIYYRLERVRELSGLDVSSSDGREKLRSKML